MAFVDLKARRSLRTAAPWSSGRSPTAQVAAWSRRAAREPLLHFLLLGAVLFAVMDTHHGPADHRIVLDHARTDKLAADYRAEYGQDPTPVEARAMADRYVSDEIYYREGLALGVDRDDEIIRRRIVQKMQFISQDRYVPDDLAPSELKAYYEKHLANYVTPARISFSHVFFGLQKGDEAAKARAEAALGGLAGSGLTRAPARGDSFTDLYDYGAMDADGLKRLFGASGIVSALAQAPVGHWSGPYRSTYGWHLVYVSTRTPAAVQPFAAVSDRVRSDYADERQVAANAEAYAKLRTRYQVIGDQAGLAAR